MLIRSPPPPPPDMPVRFFFFPTRLIWVCEIELSHMGKNNRNLGVVCEKYCSFTHVSKHVPIVLLAINTCIPGQ